MRGKKGADRGRRKEAGLYLSGSRTRCRIRFGRHGLRGQRDLTALLVLMFYPDPCRMPQSSA